VDAPSYRFEDGKMVQIPDTIVSQSGTLDEDITNTVVIEPGVALITTGRISGTVNVLGGASLEAKNNVGGTVHIEPGGRATFHAGVGGTLVVDRSAVAVLTRSAVALGSLNIQGELVNEGTRGVQVTGGRNCERSGGISSPTARCCSRGWHFHLLRMTEWQERKSVARSRSLYLRACRGWR
jgi:hypothetical protein